MKLKDIIKTKADVLADGNSVENNFITRTDINVVGHFGNCPCFEIECTNVCPMSAYNNRGNLGFLIAAFVELFDLDEEDGIRFTSFPSIPCRLVFQGDSGWGSKCIGFGHFMKDKFVYTADFAKINE